MTCWLIFVYPWQRLSHYLPEPFGLSLAAAICLGLLPVVCFYVWVKTRSPGTAVLGRLAVNWLGICLMFLNAALLTEICNFIFSPSNNTLAAILISCGLLFSIFAVYSATKITTQGLTLESDKLQKTLRAVQLSDLHLGSRSLKFVSRAINITNKLKPDMVFITGDLIDMSQVKPESLDILGQLNVPTFFVTGNHDRYVGSAEHFAAIRQAGITILNNKSVLHKGIQIMGIADENNRNQVRDRLADIDIDTTKYTVLLYHKPENFDAVIQNQIDLMLTGHTHAGQIFPFNLIVKKQFPFIKGLYQDGNSSLYVSQGTGTWGPVMRFGSANEITVFELLPT